MYNDNMMGNSYESNSFESFGAPVPGYTSVPSPAKKNESKTPLIILIAVILVMACGFAVVGMILLNQPKTKIARAMAKTVNDGGYLFEDAESKLVLTDTMTYKVDFTYKEKVDEIRGEVEIAIDKLDKQMSGKINIPYMGGYDFVAGINANDVRFKIPKLDDHVFVYNYRGSNSGFLADAAGSSEIDELNEAFADLYNTKLTNGRGRTQEDELTTATKNFYDRMTINKADSKEFEVDGASRNCAGYELVITKESLNKYIYDVENYYEKVYPDSINSLTSGDYDNFIDALKITKEKIEEAGDMSVYVYLYKGELAAIQMPLPVVDGASMEIDFKGGDYRLQNIVISMSSEGEDTELVNLAGSRSGQRDNLSFSVLGEEICTGFYDHDSGKYEMEFINEEMDVDVSVYGSFRSSKEENAYFVNAKDNKTDTTIDMKLYMYRGATMKDISGSEFDIGNASTRDFMGLDLFRNLYNIMY